MENLVQAFGDEDYEGDEGEDEGSDTSSKDSHQKRVEP